MKSCMNCANLKTLYNCDEDECGSFEKYKPKDTKTLEKISFPILNNLTPTVESCTMKVLEEVGELMQLLGKDRGKSGERQLMSFDKWTKLMVGEAIDVAQSAITMADTICKEHGLNIKVVIEDHEDKMRKKGYLK